MNLVEALREALAATKDEIAAAKKEQDELQDKLDRLTREQAGLELALARHQGREAVVPSGWGRLKRSEAIVRVLELAGNPLSPKEITTRLSSTERTDDRYELISAGLSYLKRIGVVQSAGYGRWELSPDHRPNVVGSEEEDDDT